MFILERERERVQEGLGGWGGGCGRDREGDRESEVGSKLWAVSTEPNTGLKLKNWEIITWAKVGRLIDWATRYPPTYITLKEMTIILLAWLLSQLSLLAICISQWLSKQSCSDYKWI